VDCATRLSGAAGGGGAGGEFSGGELQGAGGGLEEVVGAEAFKGFPDAGGGVVEFDDAGGRGAGGVEADAESGENAEEGAVDEGAVGEVDDEAGEIFAGEFVEDGFEIGAAGEGGAAGDFQADNVVADVDGKGGGVQRGLGIQADRPPGETIWTRACWRTRASSRLLETRRWLQRRRRSMARTSSAVEYFRAWGRALNRT